jgi:hypothetical protein
MVARLEARLLQPASDQMDFGFERASPPIAMFFNLQSANRHGGGGFHFLNKKAGHLGRCPAMVGGWVNTGSGAE